MASPSLPQRLQALADTYRNTLTLIQRLQKLPSTPGSYGNATGDADPRLELSSEIHTSLKEQEDELETITSELEDSDSFSSAGYASGAGSRRRQSESAGEREMLVTSVARLSEDLKAARSSFRRAQLDAKRSADTARRKERDLLFANRRIDPNDPDSVPQHGARRKGQEKLTADEVALNAQSDVTTALRRTHALLQQNVEQSQFAQQTLDESSEALASLGQGYAGIDSLLKNSGGLMRQLVRSNKSDTWYLTTTFYILVVTLAWLVFRRILYGPMWWLVWQPMKLIWWFSMTILSGVGIVGGKKAVTTTEGLSRSLTGSAAVRPTWPAGKGAANVPVAAKGGGWGVQRPQPQAGTGSEEKEKKLVDKIGEMAEMISGEGGLREREEEDGPANSKKRMYEQPPVGSKGRKDEL